MNRTINRTKITALFMMFLFAVPTAVHGMDDKKINQKFEKITKNIRTLVNSTKTIKDRTQKCENDIEEIRKASSTSSRTTDISLQQSIKDVREVTENLTILGNRITILETKNSDLESETETLKKNSEQIEALRKATNRNSKIINLIIKRFSWVFLCLAGYLNFRDLPCWEYLSLKYKIFKSLQCCLTPGLFLYLYWWTIDSIPRAKVKKVDYEPLNLEDDESEWKSDDNDEDDE